MWSVALIIVRSAASAGSRRSRVRVAKNPAKPPPTTTTDGREDVGALMRSPSSGNGMCRSVLTIQVEGREHARALTRRQAICPPHAEPSNARATPPTVGSGAEGIRAALGHDDGQFLVEVDRRPLRPERHERLAAPDERGEP